MLNRKLIVSPMFNQATLIYDLMKDAYIELAKLVEPGDEIVILEGDYEHVVGGKYFGVYKILVSKSNTTLGVKDIDDRWALFTESSIKGSDKCENEVFVLI
ncbi:Hypothetical protein KNT65_gp075 [Escherichia phage EcS1]|uniref:Uncharacterized protein n=1 Tax=Escherichia phage EcS1 TaxID=2083276 RepID=A0A2Z5ZCR6_9CAUD|nr:Hypothetical protein KNT65_gp075 [Escherichia phage EcS1]BBC78123.1 Hypothetical protein [Escherichia phage EcS1]